MIARLDAGSPSCENRIVKVTVAPPGMGGVASDIRMMITAAMIHHGADTSTRLFSATLIAASQYTAAVAGLYRSCPKGMPKFAGLSLTPSFPIHVFLLSASAAEDDAVVTAMRNVENILFHRSGGAIRIFTQVAAV